MNRLKRILWVLAAALLLTFQLQGCASVNSAKAIDGRVIDADTHQPMEGVSVLAHWAMQSGLEGGSYRDIKMLETVTDQDGRYHFPAWGPEAEPADLAFGSHMSFQNPEIVFFKSGYYWDAVSNQITGPRAKGGLGMDSEWNGKTIEMKKFEGDITDKSIF